MPFYCLGSPSSGKMSEVQQKQQEEVETEKKIEGKGIQTLFLEIVENPPQLHHMTFQKENATLLPPTPASSISFNTALFQSPTGQISQPTRCTSHPRTRSIAFSCIYKRIRGQHKAIATSPTPDLPSRKLFLPYRKKHDITNISFNVNRVGGKNRLNSCQQHRNVKPLQYGNL